MKGWVGGGVGGGADEGEDIFGRKGAHRVCARAGSLRTVRSRSARPTAASAKLTRQAGTQRRFAQPEIWQMGVVAQPEIWLGLPHTRVDIGQQPRACA